MRQIQRVSCTAGSLAFFCSGHFSEVLSVPFGASGFVSFQRSTTASCLSARQRQEFGHSLLVPLNAPAHKVPNDTPAVKLAGYTVRQESVLRSNSHLGVSVLLAGALRGTRSPRTKFLSFVRANSTGRQLSNLEKTRIIAGCPKGTR